MGAKRQVESTVFNEEAMPVVYTIIPVYNRLKYTLTCLHDLRTQSYKPIHIIVVDGGSTDATVAVLQQKYPDITVLCGRGELWWAGAMRVGIDHVLKMSGSDQDMILMMNNDTECDPQYIRTLVRVCRTHLTAVGSVIVDSQDRSRVLDAGEFVDWSTYSFSVRTDVDPGHTFFDGVDLLPGRGTLVPLSLIRAAGNIDDGRFPHYLADYEFFQRVRRHGFRLGVSSEAKIAAHIQETGLYSIGEILGLRRAWELVSSRKSMNNFIDHWRFIDRCAPNGFKITSWIRLTWRTLHILFLQTWLRYPIWPFVLMWRWLRFLACDHYYITTSDCSRYGLDAETLAKDRILSPWLRTDWYRFTTNRDSWWTTRPELHGLYRRAWNPSTKIQRWARARAYRAEQRKAA